MWGGILKCSFFVVVMGASSGWKISHFSVPRHNAKLTFFERGENITESFCILRASLPNVGLNNNIFICFKFRPLIKHAQLSYWTADWSEKEGNENEERGFVLKMFQRTCRKVNVFFWLTVGIYLRTILGPRQMYQIKIDLHSVIFSFRY